MAKAIVIDIDGVIIGTKPGVNTPYPHADVMAKMKSVRGSGIPIIFCTAKPLFAHAAEIIETGLDNPHIFDGGAVITNGANEIARQYNLDSMLAAELVQNFIDNGIYNEAYTTNDYFTQQDQIDDTITNMRKFVLKKPTVVVPDLAEFCRDNKITKILTNIHAGDAASYTKNFIEPFKDKVHSILINASTFADTKVGAITALGVSKQSALIEISKMLNIPLENFLGIGDSNSDWNFMQICGYVGAMGNGDQELKDNVTARGAHGHICGDVNDNGFIEMLDWYLDN